MNTRNLGLANTQPDEDRSGVVRIRRSLSRDLDRLAVVTRMSSVDPDLSAAYREKMRMIADELDGLMGKAMALEAGNG